MHDLEGDGALEPQVNGLVHGRHPAAREPGFDPVTTVQDPSDQRIAEGRVHSRSVRSSDLRSGQATPTCDKRRTRPERCLDVLTPLGIDPHLVHQCLQLPT